MLVTIEATRVMQISESRRRFVNPTRRSKDIDDTEHDLL